MIGAWCLQMVLLLVIRASVLAAADATSTVSLVKGGASRHWEANSKNTDKPHVQKLIEKQLEGTIQVCDPRFIIDLVKT